MMMLARAGRGRWMCDDGNCDCDRVGDGNRDGDGSGDSNDDDHDDVYDHGAVAVTWEHHCV